MKTEIIQKILLIIVTWLVKYLEGHHIRRNGGKKKADVDSTVTMNTEGKVVE